MAAELLSADEAGIARAAALIRGGACVAFPTETVYGLGALATDGRAVAGIYEAKGRPAFNPLIAHVADRATAEALAEMPDWAARLADRFWPGPLTLVLPMKPGAVDPLVTAGLPTLGVRVPAHPVARALLRAVDGAVAAPSANPSGRVSPTTAAHVMAGLGKRIAAVLDGGPCGVGVESTIVGSAFESGPSLLRDGGVPREVIAALAGPLAEAGEGITAPGQLASHYAPAAPLRLNATEARGEELLIGFGPVAGEVSLSETGDLTEAAARLFATLHAVDKGRPLAVAPIPQVGLGRAINDRLRRAAAPRP
ncbi:MAG: L-threonylcarbamoyladenylate synthase [Shimia sp.]